MKGIDIFREIEQIDDKYIEEAQMIRRRAWKNPRNYGSMAAVACLLICVGVYLNNGGVKQDATEMAVMDEAMEKTARGDYAIGEDEAIGDVVANDSVAESTFEDDTAALYEEAFMDGNDGYFDMDVEESVVTDADTEEMGANSEAGSANGSAVYDDQTEKKESIQTENEVMGNKWEHFEKYTTIAMPFKNGNITSSYDENTDRLLFTIDDGGMKYVEMILSYKEEGTECPIFKSSEVTVEVIESCLMEITEVGDSEKERVHMGIRFEEGVFLELRTKGLDAKQVYETLSSILE